MEMISSGLSVDSIPTYRWPVTSVFYSSQIDGAVKVSNIKLLKIRKIKKYIDQCLHEDYMTMCLKLLLYLLSV